MRTRNHYMRIGNHYTRIKTIMRDYKLRIENEKLLVEKKIDDRNGHHLLRMRNHYARNRNHHSRLSISFHSERSSVQAPSRLRASLSFASLTGMFKMAEHLIRHERRNCVNLFRKFERLSEQMSQPNHSNVNAQVSRSFGRWQFNPRAASKFLAFQTPDKHEGANGGKQLSVNY